VDEFVEEPVPRIYADSNRPTCWLNT
jgi:hypothetical protein